MSNILVTSGTLDINGNRLIESNNINSLLFYNAGSESWDTSGNSSSSWYTENTLPSDSFLGNSLDTYKWSFFSYRGSISGTVNDGLFLDIDSQDARGGISSEGLWSLSGDFDVRLYLDESSYYNEYRGNSASGLTISVDDSNKVRLSKYFDGSSIGYKSHYVEDRELKFFNWSPNGDIDTSVGDNEVTCVRLVRSGENIYGYVSSDTQGFVQVGNTLSGSVWGSDVSVQIELETEQFNKYSTSFFGITVSGTLDSPKEFSSPLRGTEKSFPNNCLLVADDLGLSLINEDNTTLWMRFKYGSGENLFRNTEATLSAVNGKVFYTTVSGLVVLDFVNDSAYIYQGTSKKVSVNNIAGRNFRTSFNSQSSAVSLPNDNVTGVSSRNIGSHEFVAVSTVSGVSLIIDDSKGLTNSDGYPYSKTIQITEAGNLYWNTFDSVTARGDLSYYYGLENLVSISGSSFIRSGFYSKDTSPVSLSSENINSISVKDLSGNIVGIGNSLGVDFIYGQSVSSFGIIGTAAEFSDPSFSYEVGVYWSPYSNTLFPVFDVYKSSSWSTDGATSLKLGLISGKIAYSGDSGGVSQNIDITSIGKIYFDIKLVNDALGTEHYTNFYDLEVLVGSDVVTTFSDISDTFERKAEYIDVVSYSGQQTVTIRLVSKTNNNSCTDKYFYVDNVRVLESNSDFQIIPSSSHNVLEVLVLYEPSEKKIFFSTEDGYGAIDILDSSLDFFDPITNKVPLSSIISAEYNETIDEV